MNIYKYIKYIKNLLYYCYFTIIAIDFSVFSRLEIDFLWNY